MIKLKFKNRDTHKTIGNWKDWKSKDGERWSRKMQPKESYRTKEDLKQKI